MRTRLTDGLTNADQARSAQCAMGIVSKHMQDYAPGEQVHAACSVFLLLCDHYGVSAQDAFTAAKNMINDAPRRQVPEFLAVRMYVENEL